MKRDGFIYRMRNSRFSRTSCSACWTWTESSYKYRADDIVAMVERAGFVTINQWSKGGFALTLAEAR